MEENCNDKKCPFHGLLQVNLEPKILGIVVKKSIGMAKIQLVKYSIYKKYERPLKRIIHVQAHIPKCIQNKIFVNSRVFYILCRPLSKIKRHVILDYERFENKKN